MSASSGELFALHSRLQNQTMGFVPPSQLSYKRCNERWGDTRAACVHCTVDCPMVWPKLGRFFQVVQCIGMSSVALTTSLESLLSTDLITAILTADKVVLPKE